jgi:hypothetical protein
MGTLPLYLMVYKKVNSPPHLSLRILHQSVYMLGADQIPFGRVARPASVILPSSIILRARSMFVSVHRDFVRV